MLYFLLLAGMCSVHAQILEQSVQKIKSLQNVSYTDVVSTKFSFEEGFVVDTLNSQVLFVPEEGNIAGYYYIKGRDHSYAFDGNKMVNLNLKDSTYQVQKESVNGQYTRSLLYWASELEKLIDQPANKVVQLPDTLLNNRAYAHIKVTDFDSIANNEHVYEITDFVFDKKNQLPFLISRRFKGLASDGTFFGLIENHAYDQYQLDQKNFPDLSVASIPDHFKPPAKRLPVEYLPNGTPSPPLNVHDLTGKELQLTTLKGKVVLLNFSLIGCPHCVGAAQMLNRLYDRYNDKVVILNIYPIDQVEAIAKFDKREKVKTASFTTEKSVLKDFPIDGYPSFYLLDKGGVVIQSYKGFFNDMESQIVAQIDSISK